MNQQFVGTTISFANSRSRTLAVGWASCLVIQIRIPRQGHLTTMYEVDSYKGYDFNMWTLVASTCFISVLYFWIDTRFGYWHTVVFHIFWMEWVRLASILLLPRLWHKARGRYPSPAVRVRFSTQFTSFLVVCLLMYHNLAIIPIWRTTPPFLVPDETGENSTLAK